MAIPTPVVNEGLLYINGLNLSYATTTTMTVGTGQCRNSSDVVDINVDAALTINTASSGVNGLDQGSIANNTLYAVFVVADSSEKLPVCAMLSTSATAPVLPYGYDAIRRLGWVRTNGSAQILDFTQRGAGALRNMYYAASIATDITAGASATFAAVDASGSAPSTAVELIVKATLTADAGGTRSVALRDGGSTSAAGQSIMSAAASTVIAGMMNCPCGASGDIDYLVSNASAAVALNVQGYVDALV